MNRQHVYVSLVCLSSLLVACAATDGGQTPDKPRVIEVFACSDYCPGPKRKYLKKVYEGVDDAETCEALGGKPYIYHGWGSTFICVVPRWRR